MAPEKPLPRLLVALMGPTASGKTALSIEIARHLNTEILSVDSRQFYREMNIGTAKPSAEELAAVPHYFINNLSINEEYTAGRFAKDALAMLEALFARHNVVIAVGGSTLYYKALLEGIDELPPVPVEIRESVRKVYGENGLAYLQAEVQKLDPVYFSKADKNNPRRLMRALEVCLASGQAYSSFLAEKPGQRNFKILKIGLELDRDILYERINERCEQMISNGLLDEVKSLLPFRTHTALHTVGYTEFFDYIDGKFSWEQAISLFKQHTRNYAKRQLTWLRREHDMRWYAPSDTEGIMRLIEAEIKNLAANI